jgi:hypothetical protein
MRTQRILLSVALAGACSAPLDRAAYTEAMAEAMCARVVECCSVDERSSWALADAAACRSAYVSMFGAGINNLGMLVDNGEIDYSADRYEACLARLRTASCGELAAGGAFQRPLEPCDDILVPSRSDGEACSASSSCDSGYCPSETDRCTPIAVAGQPCTETQLCVGGSCSTVGICTDAYCDDAGICQPRRAIGAACSSGLECESIACDGGTCVEREYSCDGV